MHAAQNSNDANSAETTPAASVEVKSPTQSSRESNLQQLATLPSVLCSYHFDPNQGTITLLAYQEPVTGKRVAISLATPQEKAVVMNVFRQASTALGGLPPPLLNGQLIAQQAKAMQMGPPNSPGVGPSVQVLGVSSLKRDDNTEVTLVAFVKDGVRSVLERREFERLYPHLFAQYQWQQQRLQQQQMVLQQQMYQ